MKKLFLIVCLLLSFANLANAQTYTDRRVARMQKLLDLTDQQTAQCSLIFKQEVFKLDSAKKAGAKRKETNAIFKELDEKFKAILTEEQVDKYLKIMNQARSVGSGH